MPSVHLQHSPSQGYQHLPGPCQSTRHQRSPRAESWPPQEGDHTSIASYRSVDKLETEILSSSIPDVLLGQQEGVMLLVSPAHQRSELMAEGPWSLTMVGMRGGFCAGLWPSPCVQVGLCAEQSFLKCAQHETYFSALHNFIAKVILSKTPSSGSYFMRKQTETSIQTRQNSRAVVQD